MSIQKLEPSIDNVGGAKGPTVQWLCGCCRILIGGVFAYAVAAKLHLIREGGRLQSTTMIGEWTNGSVLGLALLTGVEALIVVWLIAGVKLRWCAVAVLALLLAFSGLIGRELAKVDPKPCGCTGVAATPDSSAAAVRKSLAVGLWRNGLLLAAAITMLVESRPANELEISAAEDARAGDFDSPAFAVEGRIDASRA